MKISDTVRTGCILSNEMETNNMGTRHSTFIYRVCYGLYNWPVDFKQGMVGWTSSCPPSVTLVPMPSYFMHQSFFPIYHLTVVTSWKIGHAGFQQPDWSRDFGTVTSVIATTVQLKADCDRTTGRPSGRSVWHWPCLRRFDLLSSYSMRRVFDSLNPPSNRYVQITAVVVGKWQALTDIRMVTLPYCPHGSKLDQNDISAKIMQKIFLLKFHMLRHAVTCLLPLQWQLSIFNCKFHCYNCTTSVFNVYLTHWIIGNFIPICSTFNLRNVWQLLKGCNAHVLWVTGKTFLWPFLTFHRTWHFNFKNIEKILRLAAAVEDFGIRRKYQQHYICI